MVSADDYRRGRSVVSALHAHLVFVTKYRRGVLTDELLTRCEEVMREVCANFNTTLVEFNGEHDHLHLLIEYPTTVQLSKLVNSLKGVGPAAALRVHLLGEPAQHERPPMVAVLFRHILWRRTSVDRRPIHRPTAPTPEWPRQAEIDALTQR
jgi:REP element-mobilizing transposase RayT